MFVSEQAWEKISEQFSSGEKRTLHSAVLGRMICPRGFSINREALDAGLAEKLTLLLRSTQAPQKRG